MTALARRLFLTRERLVAHGGIVIAVAAWPLLASGMFAVQSRWGAGLVQLAALLLLAGSVVRAVVREIQPTRRETRARAAAIREFEIGLLIVTSVFALLAATGGLRSPLYPALYALISFVWVVGRSRAAAAGTVAAAVALECLVGAKYWMAGVWIPTTLHVLLILFFASSNALVLTSLVRRMRSEHSGAISDALARMRQEAHDFRLISSQLPAESRSRSREEEEARMAQGAVESIHDQVFHHLDMLRSAMQLNACALLWCKEVPSGGRDTGRLSLKEIATDSDLVRGNPDLEQPGVLAAVLRDPKPLRLHALSGKRVPPYYDGPEPVTDLCVVPLREDGRLRGLLCADRVNDHRFEDAELATLEKASEHLLRVVAHERVFAAIERGKYEQEQFYRASESLNEALTLETVLDRSLEAISAIAPYDLAVITAAEPNGGHRVLGVRVRSHDSQHETEWTKVAEQLDELRFSGEQSLVGLAVKNRHYVPASGALADPDTVVFTPETKVGKGQSVLVLPLSRGDEVLGTVTLVSERAGQYPGRVREMLRVIGHQVAVSLQNARMYQAMEEQATTDGLTGLTNHRAFQERFATLHALAERTGQRFSVILTDIDHFKSVNDTYGHPVGDLVLKRAASIFASRARKVDIVARYGGEEFVFVLPDTDGEGAAIFANKLREELGAQVIKSDIGNFNVTISMGIAEFPNDSGDRAELVERADQALYACKEGGRNCVRRWAELRR